MPTERTGEQAWAIANAAHERRLREALRDFSIWRSQLLCCLVGVLKLASGILAVSLCFAAAGLDAQVSLLVALYVIPLAAVFWPKPLFRNLFRDEADKAFTNALADLGPASKT